jgi:hypothetical protein
MSQFHPSGARVMPSRATLPLQSSRAPAAALGGGARRAPADVRNGEGM